MLDLTHKPQSLLPRPEVPGSPPASCALAGRDELAGQVESLTRLHELAMRLGGISELEPALQAVLDTAVESQNAQLGLIWLYEPECGALVARASRGFSEASLIAFDRVTPGSGGGSAGKAFERRERWAIEDVEADPDFAPFREAARGAGFRAIHSTPIVTRAGELLGVLSVHFRHCRVPAQRDMQLADVCARHAADAIEAHRSQEAARRSELIYHAIGESLDYGVWMADGAGRITHMSECFLDLVGRSAERLQGDGWKEAVHPDDLAAVSAAWEQCVREGRKWDYEFRVRGADGAWYEILGRAVPMRDERGVILGWAGINLDIGRLKRVEEELRGLDQRKNEFLATLAHELRNPLAPLRSGLEVLRLASGDAAASARARGMMERQLGQLVRLVDDLLDVSRVSRGKIDLRRAEVELAAVLRNAIETSQPLMRERGHQLAVRMPAERIVVHADLTRLSQVFWNLLNNAAKYTENGGHIDVDVAMHGAEAEIVVRDDGIGIPPGMQARVFDIFTQVGRPLEKAQGGLGIGLSIARRLVEMHGGRIEVASDGTGAGSEFRVRLPAWVAERAADPGPAPASVRPAPPRRVLVADDNEDAADTLAMMLEVQGNEVRVAHDGEAAVEMARAFRPDAILLDIGMPKLNGYDACAQIRRDCMGPQPVIFALTGWSQEQDRARSRAAGFDRHLVKPVDPSQLGQLIGAIPGR